MLKRVASSTRGRILISITALVLLALLVYRIPQVNSALWWRVEKFTIYVLNLVRPVQHVPTALPVTRAPVTPSITPTESLANLLPTVTPTSTFMPLPAKVALPSPPHEYQTPNNCGPAVLSMALHMYGWEGDQADIAERIKPVARDRNVNPEELRYYVRNEAGWLNLEYRVNGSIALLKQLLAANYPVVIEGTTTLDPDDGFGAHDDLWAAHYLLLTGYDDATQTFITQDPLRGPDRAVSYAQLEADWKPFNYVYLIIYFPEWEQEVKDLLASNWDPHLNRQSALAASQAATVNDPSDAFAWFNLGSNLVYFERYDEAALAYDKARQIGLPFRMFRYQFGPFHAYFYSDRIDDLDILTEYAAHVTHREEQSEEIWFWRGWALYRKGDVDGALKAWNKAKHINPNYYDDQAQKAIDFVTNP